MLVFQICDPDDPFCSVDVFIRNPIAFEDVWARSIRANLGATACRIASIEDLIAMKTAAGRPQDLRDIEELRQLSALAQGKLP
jgi:CMP-2-keto-3-deoxyoctulosonic acid synthetase